MSTARAPADARDALVERLFEAVLGMTDVYMVYLGDRLGLYAALAAGHATEAQSRRPRAPTAATCASGSSSRR